MDRCSSHCSCIESTISLCLYQSTISLWLHRDNNLVVAASRLLVWCSNNELVGSMQTQRACFQAAKVRSFVRCKHNEIVHSMHLHRAYCLDAANRYCCFDAVTTKDWLDVPTTRLLIWYMKNEGVGSMQSQRACWLDASTTGLFL